MAERPCLMCDPLAVDVNHFERLGVPRLDTIPLLETTHFKVIADVLAAAPFHALVIPKEHRYSFAMFPELHYEMGALTYELEYILGQPIAILEHGGAGPGANHQSIYHAHAHIVTTELNPIPILSDDFARRNVSHTSFAVADHSHIETVTTYASGTNYLYAQSAGAALLAIDVDGTHPSQQIQRALGTQYYGSFLNWKQIGHDSDDSLAKLSVQRMLSTIDRCRNGSKKGRIL